MQKTHVEISGTMTANTDGENITINGIRIDINCIKSNNKNSIEYDPDKYIEKIVQEMSNQSVHINFHTHPGFFELAKLSYSDTKLAKLHNEIAEFISKEQQRQPIIVINGIVNRKEMAFYILDKETEKIIRIPLFVDGIEIIPYHELVGMKYYYESSKTQKK